MAQLSRPYQIILGVVVVFGLIWAVALPCYVGRRTAVIAVLSGPSPEREASPFPEGGRASNRVPHRGLRKQSRSSEMKGPGSSSAAKRPPLVISFQ